MTTERTRARVSMWKTERGYGFLALRGTWGGLSVFLHVSDTEGLADGHDHPDVGDLVEFAILATPKGPRAIQARIVERAPAGEPANPPAEVRA